MNIKINIKLFKFLQDFIKYSVFFGLLIMIIQVGLLINGIESQIPLTIVVWTFGNSFVGFIMLFLASLVLKLCWNFRLALMYNYLVTQCIFFRQRYPDMFGEYLDITRLVVLCIGLIILGRVYLNKYNICNNIKVCY